MHIFKHIHTCTHIRNLSVYIRTPTIFTYTNTSYTTLYYTLYVYRSQAALHQIIKYDTLDDNKTIPYLKVFRKEHYNIFNYIGGNNIIHTIRAGFNTSQDRLDFVKEKTDEFLRSIGK